MKPLQIQGYGNIQVTLQEKLLRNFHSARHACFNQPKVKGGGYAITLVCVMFGPVCVTVNFLRIACYGRFGRLIKT